MDSNEENIGVWKIFLFLLPLTSQWNSTNVAQARQKFSHFLDLVWSWRSGLKLQDDVQLYFPSQIWGIYLNPILTKNNLSELLQSPSVFKIKYPKIEYFIYSRNRIDNVRRKRQTIRLNIYLSMCNVKWMSFIILHCSRQSSILLKLSKYSIFIVKRNILIILDFRSTPPDFRGFQTNLK